MATVSCNVLQCESSTTRENNVVRARPKACYYFAFTVDGVARAHKKSIRQERRRSAIFAHNFTLVNFVI